jgi:hypothetical protein
MRHGQAALEFLATYGWAMLVVLISIGALAYFGVFNAGDAQPESCLMSTGLACGGYQLKSIGQDTQLTLYLKNSFGKAIKLQEITITPHFSIDATDCDQRNLNGQRLENGHETAIICNYTSSTSLLDGEKQKLSVSLTYRDADGVFNKQAQGDIVVNNQV